MTPTTIVLACLAIFFFGAWLSARRTVASREKSILAGTNMIADLQRRNFEAGAKIQRLESQIETANEELAGFKAGVKAATEDRAVKAAVHDLVWNGVIASSGGAATKPTAKANPKPAIKAASKPVRKAPAKKAARK